MGGTENFVSFMYLPGVSREFQGENTKGGRVVFFSYVLCFALHPNFILFLWLLGFLFVDGNPNGPNACTASKGSGFVEIHWLHLLGRSSLVQILDFA